ncbi:DUF22 domain-containing protein [Methanobrevibacter arboriphilus]|uniref:DUF22 domain-containing protein n=1 Tax=Methanobrevibacter arboriphilus TaxID=39441 RepID=UPI0006D12635|nr:DUF22 domain-containing protein [Methanobrevibacter arboriphilus]
MVRFLNPVGEFKRELKSSQSKMDLKMGDIPILSRVIVADENAVLENGKSVSIKIKEISIPAKHIVSISSYAANKYGHPIAVVQKPTSLFQWIKLSIEQLLLHLLMVLLRKVIF